MWQTFPYKCPAAVGYSSTGP